MKRSRNICTFYVVFFESCLGAVYSSLSRCGKKSGISRSGDYDQMNLRVGVVHLCVVEGWRDGGIKDDKLALVKLNLLPAVWASRSF